MLITLRVKKQCWCEKIWQCCHDKFTVCRYTDVLVGAPYYTHAKDEGRVYMYLNNGQVCFGCCLR